MLNYVHETSVGRCVLEESSLSRMTNLLDYGVAPLASSSAKKRLDKNRRILFLIYLYQY